MGRHAHLSGPVLQPLLFLSLLPVVVARLRKPQALPSIESRYLRPPGISLRAFSGQEGVNEDVGCLILNRYFLPFSTSCCALPIGGLLPAFGGSWRAGTPTLPPSRHLEH